MILWVNNLYWAQLCSSGSSYLCMYLQLASSQVDSSTSDLILGWGNWDN